MDLVIGSIPVYACDMLKTLPSLIFNHSSQPYITDTNELILFNIYNRTKIQKWLTGR